ncbi:hypothetical protein N4R57_02425 [Rhodobacteraceae bacterium D3-12]|nr:hypothetical protein N4R57_02425 [Rhodobacteraceae bacterium D3-12]
MTQFLLASNQTCEIPGFDPADDILVVALPEDDDGGLDHALSFRQLRSRSRKTPALEVALSHTASGTDFRIRLPGVTQLSPDSIAVLSLTDADTLANFPDPADAPDTPDATQAPAAAPRAAQAPSPMDPNTPRKYAFVHDHSWHVDGPPATRSFDLSHPDSEIDVTLKEGTGGPIYAIRQTETYTARSGARSRQCAILLAQTKPGTPHLNAGILGQWVASRLGGPDFRTVAQIDLGRESFAPGQDTPTGKINESPNVAIHGTIAGSIAVEF